jgi:hypothetical protein
MSKRAVIYDQDNEREGTAAPPDRISQRPPERRRVSLPTQPSLRHNEDRRNILVVIIMLAWLIITIKLGPDWLTPIQIGFFALLLNSSTRARCPICGGKEPRR